MRMNDSQKSHFHELHSCCRRLMILMVLVKFIYKYIYIYIYTHLTALKLHLSSIVINLV